MAPSKRKIGRNSNKPKEPGILTVAQVSKELGLKAEGEKLIRRAPLFPTARAALFAPYGFFEKIRFFSVEAGGIYLLLISAFPAIWIFFANIGFLGGVFPAMQAASYGYIFVVFSSIVSALLAHLALKLLGGKGRLSETMNSFFFGGTPWFLLASLPLASFFGLFWSIYLESLGLAKAHGIGKVKAVLGALFPLFLAIFAAFVFVSMNPELARQIAEQAGNYSANSASA